MPHRFDPAILREYDIRGIVGTNLSAADAGALGRAFAATLAKSGSPGGKYRVAVGYDGRLTSPELEAALVAGLTAGSADVVRIGRGPTPMLYFAAATLGVDAGIMVTGSHNPPSHNGFKMVLAGKPFYAEQIQQLGVTALALGEPSGPPGQVEDHAIADDYIARLARDYDSGKELRVAWDPGNGATGEIVTQLTALLPGVHHLINAAIDGRFPAHHPDPTVAENLVQLQDEVARRGSDLGIAFDGDGDRIGVVDATGRILWGDQLMIVLARDVLKRHPGAPILADVKASDVLFAEIARAGGRPVMLPTGHSPIKAKLAELQAPLAGEMSGHIFFGDRWYGFDDAIYVAVRLLGILARSDDSLADIADRLPVMFNTPELRIDCDEARKFAIVAEIAERLRRRNAEVIEIDGVRVKSADGWWLVRASNTQAVIVARAESTSPDGLQRLKGEITRELAESGLDVKLG
jgi:phosphomannomutase